MASYCGEICHRSHHASKQTVNKHRLSSFLIHMTNLERQPNPHFKCSLHAFTGLISRLIFAFCFHFIRKNISNWYTSIALLFARWVCAVVCWTYLGVEVKETVVFEPQQQHLILLHILFHQRSRWVQPPERRKWNKKKRNYFKRFLLQ